MEEDVKSAGDYLAALRRRKRQLVLPMVILFIISVAVALGLPAVYRSSATILIEQQDIPEEMVQSTITTFADQRIQIISQRVMTTSNLMKIIEKYGLYKDELEKLTKEEVLEEMREEDMEFDMVSAEVMDPRSGRPMAATIAFTLAFNSESPGLAQKVANELVSLYLNENLRSRKEKTAETSNFLKEESERLAKEIEQLEKRLANFKEASKGSTPDLLSMNMQLMQRVEGDINNNIQKLQSLEQREIYLESELAQIDPYTTMYSETGRPILGAESRLKAKSAELITLQSTYSPNHPDIIKMRKEVAALEKEVGGAVDNSEMYLTLDGLKADLAISREKYSKDHPDVKKVERAVAQLQKEIDAYQEQDGSEVVKKDREPDNPAYIQLSANLESVKADIQGTLTVQKKYEDKFKEYEERITKTPQTEREYMSITRDYDNAVLKYREIKAKLMQATLAEEMEKGSKGERFSLIEPPLLPEKPDKPNRLAIIFLGLVLSIASGIGTVAVAESMDHGVRGQKRVASLLGAMPLAVIPYIIDDEDIARKKKSRLRFVLLTLAAIVITLVTINFMFKPLDVLWYVLMRKLDIMLL